MLICCIVLRYAVLSCPVLCHAVPEPRSSRWQKGVLAILQSAIDWPIVAFRSWTSHQSELSIILCKATLLHRPAVLAKHCYKSALVLFVSTTNRQPTRAHINLAFISVSFNEQTCQVMRQSDKQQSSAWNFLDWGGKVGEDEQSKFC